MKNLTRIALIAIVLAGVCPAAYCQYSKDRPDKGKDEFDIVGLCRRLKGRLVDNTGNHGKDHRIWSRSLHQWRDLYVYLPPGYDPCERYPIVIYLHPFAYEAPHDWTPAASAAAGEWLNSRRV